MSNTMKGRFRPTRPDKYNGDVANIIYRSSWEMAFMCRLDKDPDIIWWSSEETIIPYVSPVDQRLHRYFPDFRYKTGDGKTHLVEIKPLNQTQPPKQPKRITKQFIARAAEYAVNKAKWKAAELFCEELNWDFTILTEKELGISP